MPQPREGPPFVAVLAAPLRVGGWPVGTLEVYSREKTAWSPVYVALLESLAAQASVSLEAADLFERVAAERRRLEAVLRATPIGIAVANADCTDVRLNPAGAALFGIPPDTNVAAAVTATGAAPPAGAGATGPWQLFADGDRLPRRAIPAPPRHPRRGGPRAGAGGAAPDRQAVTAAGPRLAHAGGRRRGGGEPEGAVAAFVDITPQKELQRELDARRREAEEASVPQDAVPGRRQPRHPHAGQRHQPAGGVDPPHRQQPGHGRRGAGPGPRAARQRRLAGQPAVRRAGRRPLRLRPDRVAGERVLPGGLPIGRGPADAAARPAKRGWSCSSRRPTRRCGCGPTGPSCPASWATWSATPSSSPSGAA